MKAGVALALILAGAAPALAAPPPDLAYGAFQRGLYLAAALEATKRLEAAPDAAAMTLLGMLYEDGLGVPPDVAKAARFYGAAVERGDPHAAFRLGFLRLGKSGLPADEAAAAYNLGLLALKPDAAGTAPDFAGALRWFRQGAEAGNNDARYALASLIVDGAAGPPDLPAAMALYEAAARGGHVDSMIELAIALYNGKGVAANEGAAAGWFLQAAEKGSPIAMNRLARLYAVGRGVPADPVAALMWHYRARALGNDDDWLDGFEAEQPQPVREAAAKAAIAAAGR